MPKRIEQLPYPFIFDLSQISRSLFSDIAQTAQQTRIHTQITEQAQLLVQKYKLSDLTELSASEATLLIEDLVKLYLHNLSCQEQFFRMKQKALFLPHCSRKYMDNRCQARFDQNTPSYHCVHCSADCLISQATTKAKDKGYDVYIVPGGSCISKILRQRTYGRIVGVACSEELKIAEASLVAMKMCGQGIPLTKNGCVNTKFNIESLDKTL